MFKKFLKILGVLICMWFLSMMTILRDVKYKHSLLNDHMAYERALSKLDKNYFNSTQSAFQVWRMIKPIRLNMTLEDKLAVLKEFDYPPGVNGTPVILDDYLQHYVRILVKKGWSKYAFNQFVSDVIPVTRTLPDVRHIWCKAQNYTQELPSVSIIICFYNEAWSTLLRTVHSVINRTPTRFFKEIILFDDFSTLPHLKSDLEEYVRRLPKVILAKSAKREGLIRARLKAMQYATGEVMVFLDSHCECTKGWLEPLLARIAKNPTTLVSPVIDSIDENTFEYIVQNYNNLSIGGFNWRLKFKWIDIPKEIKLKRTNPAAPINSPTISGGVFAINRKFFETIGLYDKGLDIWGAENLELSFKTWMCGGSIEIIPCSHVGHVFRKRMPYKIDQNSMVRNFVRVAEVWMDNYKEYFMDRIGNPKINYRDVSERKQLRVDLKCNSFEWYLNTIYPQLEIPNNYAASGRIFNIDFGLCLDTTFSTKQNVELNPCHNNGGNQFWMYTSHGQIKQDENCLEYMGRKGLLMCACTKGVETQRWMYNNMTYLIKNIYNQKCLQVSRTPNNRGYQLTLNNCTRPTIPVQKWAMDKFIMDKLETDLYSH